MPKTAKKKISLKERYNLMNAGQKQAFLDKIMKKCHASQPTVYRWIAGTSEPRYTEKLIIANALAIQIEEL